MKNQRNSKWRLRKWKFSFLPNSLSSTYKWSPSDSLQLWFFRMGTSKIFKFSNCPKRWNIRSFLRIGWESEKIVFFRIQCQVYWNDPRQILYNSGFFVRELQIFSIIPSFSIFVKKWLCPRKKFVTGKFFRFRDFRFKTFWIDSDQKNRAKIFDCANFHHFGPNITFL